MALPQLTFFCELDSSDLQQFFTEALVADLAALEAKISLAIPEPNQERASVVKRLNSAGIPLTAWLLLPEEHGYWLNAANAPISVENYRTFKAWTDKNELQWESVGLDIEPDLRTQEQLAARKLRLAPLLLKRATERQQYKTAQKIYSNLVDEIHEDGYLVESYLHPFIADERKAKSSLLRRLTGIVDIPVDREVWMLYSSYARPHGAGFLSAYAPEAQAVAVGSTGGGMDPNLGNPPPLDWQEFSRDLRLSWYWCDDLYIFSLEGCVHQGFLEKLKNFTWDQPILLPEADILWVQGWRRALGSVLWLSGRTTALMFGLALALLLGNGLNRMRKRK